MSTTMIPILTAPANKLAPKFWQFKQLILTFSTSLLSLTLQK
jgi:hypothetical protein